MDEKQDIKGKSRKMKKYYILILILFLFLLGGTLVHFRSNAKRSRLHSKIEELHAKGYPVTLEELDKSYSIPDGVENAADFILDAVSNYKEPNDSRLLVNTDLAALFPQGKPLSDEIKAYLHDNQKSLESLHKAAALKYCRYPVNLSTSQTLKVLDIQKMVRLLGVESAVHAENNDSEASAKSLISSFNIAASLTNAPLFICQVGRMLYQGLNVETLEHIMNTTDFSDEQLASFCEIIKDINRPSGISFGLTGELCRTIDEFTKLTTTTNLSGSNMSIPERLFFSVYRGVGLIESDGIIYLDIIEKFIEAGKLPLEKRRDATRQIRNEMANVSSIHIQLRNNIPNYSNMLSDELTSISKLRAARTALAVQRYRLKHGELPDLLSSLVPEFLESVPLDPFDGKELRYKKLYSGFVVYSIDEDLIDDGGQEEPKDRRQKVPHWDITFTIRK